MHVSGMAKVGWLFTGASGDALDYGFFRRAHFSPAFERLGFTDVTIHTLRHTRASLLIAPPKLQLQQSVRFLVMLQ